MPPRSTLEQSFENSISNSFALAENLAASGRQREKAAPNDFALLANSYPQSQLGGMSGDSSAIAAAREQYKHHRGRPYAAIRVVAERIAGQQLVVAKIGKPTRQNSRSLTDYIQKGFIRADQVDKTVKRYITDDVEILPEDKLLDVFDNPNEVMLPSTLWMVSVANLMVTGRCIWVVDPNPERPQILPIPTTWATPVHDKASGKLYVKWIIRPPGSTEKWQEIDGDFVANFYIPDPEDPFGCISMLGMQMDAIHADEAISTAQRQTFKNEINPRMALMIGEAATGDGKRQMKLQPHQRQQLIAWIRQEYAGAQKYGLPMILDAIIKDIKPIGNSPKEIPYAESSGLTQKQIFGGFGVPLSSAGISEGEGYGPNGVADHTLVQNVVNPIAKLFSEGIQAWVVRLFHKPRERIRCWIIPADAYDPDLRIRLITAARQTYSITRNEMRHEMGLPRKDGMDDIVVPMTFQSFKIGEPVVPAVKPPAGGGAPAAGEPGTGVPTSGGPPNDAADNENMRTENRTFEERKDFHDLFVKDARAQWLKVHGDAEKTLGPTLKRYFTGQTASIVAMIRGMETPDAKFHGDILARLFVPEMWTEELVRTVRPIILKQMIRGATLNLTLADKSVRFYRKDSALIELPRHIEDGVQISIDQTMSHLVDNHLWNDINETTKQKLSFVLQEGMTEGDTLGELANRIEREMGADWAGQRALKIARTESGAALNAGHYAAQLELEADGIAFGQEWCSIIDDVTRPDHVDMDGVQVKAGEEFDVAGTMAPYPGWYGLPAEQRVHCRCFSVPLTEPLEASFGGRLTKFSTNAHQKNGHARANCC